MVNEQIRATHPAAAAEAAAAAAAAEAHTATATATHAHSHTYLGVGPTGKHNRVVVGGSHGKRVRVQPRAEQAIPAGENETHT